MSEHKTSWMAADSSCNGRFMEHEKIEEGIWFVMFLSWLQGIRYRGFSFFNFRYSVPINSLIVLSQAAPYQLYWPKSKIVQIYDHIQHNNFIFPDWTNKLTKTRSIKNQIIGKSEVMNNLKMVLVLELKVQDHCKQVWTFFFFFSKC